MDSNHSKKKIDIDPELRIRKETHTKIILEKMVAHKFLHDLEERLSDREAKRIWNACKLTPPSYSESYVWWFFRHQEQFFQKLHQQLATQNSSSFEMNGMKICRHLEKRVNILIQLCEDEENHELYQNFVSMRTLLGNLERKIVFAPSHQIDTLRYKLSRSIVKLADIQHKISADALKCINQN